ncbi:SDR family NAD(P)-dependent oxidoreductase [Granulicella sp. 5B5]|uniref:SDR family NAD(P)-dependent oxidoreductase n=1 Tax=Granulicella sp. 5B5 TaxID=1617967 RepID=UPI0015F5718D|nr:SDR family oxidoreductase [Granulicella sp. 5B5]QMV19126.1 SDR family NAD(P)-dependent oxidoreductase [Granulicella sp. 5B5]
MSLSSKGTALVTGASTGIGAVYADRLAKRGYDLILVARNQSKLNEVATQLASTGRHIETLQADLNTSAGVETVAARLRTDTSITALINNAGVAATSKLLDSNINDLESMIYLNITALTRLALAAAPAFVARGNGLIINIASIVALAPELLNGTYSGTKAYVVNFSQALRNEVADKGVTVQAVLPGATATPLWAKAGLPVHNLPAEIVMSAEDMVDASLAGLDQGEAITIPSLPEIADWEKFEAARKALGPNLSRREPAARYGITA